MCLFAFIFIRANGSLTRSESSLRAGIGEKLIKGRRGEKLFARATERRQYIKRDKAIQYLSVTTADSDDDRYADKRVDDETPRSRSGGERGC